MHPWQLEKNQRAASILSHGSPGMPRLWLNNTAKWRELFRTGSVWGSRVPGGIAHHKTLRVGVLGVGVVIRLAGRALELLEVFLIIELLHLKQSGKNELCNRGKTVNSSICTSSSTDQRYTVNDSLARTKTGRPSQFTWTNSSNEQQLPHRHDSPTKLMPPMLLTFIFLQVCSAFTLDRFTEHVSQFLGTWEIAQHHNTYN